VNSSLNEPSEGQSKNKWLIDSLASQNTHFLQPFQFLLAWLSSVRITSFIKKPHEDLNLLWHFNFPNIFVQKKCMARLQ
jgi:hypothetical protein